MSRHSAESLECRYTHFVVGKIQTGQEPTKPWTQWGYQRDIIKYSDTQVLDIQLKWHVMNYGNFN